MIRSVCVTSLIKNKNFFKSYSCVLQSHFEVCASQNKLEKITMTVSWLLKLPLMSAHN